MPTDIYDLYKPLRNYLRQFALIPSLVNIWHYSNHLTYNNSLPPHLRFTNNSGIPIKVSEQVFPWDLDILIRELILHAGSQGLTMGNQRELSKAVNLLRYIDNETSKRRQGESDYDVIFELHRMGNRQFAAQIKPSMPYFIRHHKINSGTGMEPVILKETGLDLTDYLKLGMATAGSFQNNASLNIKRDYTVILYKVELSQRIIPILKGNIRSSCLSQLESLLSHV